MVIFIEFISRYSFSENYEIVSNLMMTYFPIQKSSHKGTSLVSKKKVSPPTTTNPYKTHLYFNNEKSKKLISGIGLTLFMFVKDEQIDTDI